MKEKLHIVPHNHAISKVDREQLHGHATCVVWFTGLSGSGKSTLASALEKMLFSKGVSTYILDGDNIRLGLNKDLDFTDAGRIENIRRVGEVAKLFLDAGIVVLTAFVSPFKAERQMVRELVGDTHFIEVFVDCPLEICETRDVKGLYKKARAGEISNFTGISSPFEKPDSYDFIVPTHVMSVEEGVNMIYENLKTKLELL